MLSIDHLSYSSISSFLTCGKAWKYRYIDKVQAPTSQSLIIGSCVHDVVEEMIRCKTLGIDVPDTTEIATQNVQKRLETVTPDNNTLDAENVQNEVLRLISAPLILSGVNMIRAKVDDEGAMIERKVTLEVPEVDVPIIGYIDIVLDDDTPADFKTASRSWTAERAQSEMQPVFYLAAMGQMGFPVNWHFKHIVFVKNKTPKFQTFDSERKPAEIGRLFTQIQDVWRSMKSETFLPAAPGSWKCSPKFCDYYTLCQGE